jgi:hypothetical protein
MGQRKAKKAAFLAANPYCCFCGGETASAEPDHVPSRVLFKSRHWPEGYEFPACVSCNRSTRHDEQVVAMLSRIYPDPQSPEEDLEMRELMRAIQHNYPEVLQEMQPSVRQLRNAAKKYGIEKPEGGIYADIPAISVNGPLVNKAVINFGRKLFCALYYKHTNKILRHGGGIGVWWYTNLQLEAGKILSNLENVMPGFPKLERSRQDLGDQFFYRWGVADTGNVAVFLAKFRQSFGIVRYLHQNINKILESDLVEIIEPNGAQQVVKPDA